MKWQNARRKSGGEWTLTGPEGIRRASDAEMAKLAQAGELGPRALAAWEGRASGGSAPPAPPSPGTPPTPPASAEGEAPAPPFAREWHHVANATLAAWEREQNGEGVGEGAGASEAESGLAGAMREQLRTQGMEPRDEEPPPAA